jgi:pimeloyl-ACP methyl ester carboxylesterase
VDRRHAWRPAARRDGALSEKGYFGARLPIGVRSRRIEGVNGLSVHLLEAGEVGRPALLLLHGFPELAWSWRKLMPRLAAAGYHVIAPDQRGYGKTIGWDARFDGDLASFRQFNLAQDIVELLFALGLSEVRAVIGHDFGSSVAAHCALVRPDLFRALVMMSAPFAGTPAPAPPSRRPASDLAASLARLTPPRKHYQWYFSGPDAEADMLGAPQGLPDFLRAYYHVKSADWAGNRPHPLAGWSADQLAQLPDYYVMPLAATMPAAVAPVMPSQAEIAHCAWLADDDLAVYARAFAETGLQGGLNWYRCATSGLTGKDLRLFAGRQIEVPAAFIAGAADWGVFQSPGAFEAMQTRGCAEFRGVTLIEGAGHWVQQEQPAATADALLAFLAV